MTKKKLYWIFQIGGWSLYILLTIIFGSKFTEEKLSTPGLELFFMEGLFFLLITHGYRYLIIKKNWLVKSMRSLIPIVILSTVVMGFVVYSLRVLVTYILGIFNFELLNITNMLGLTFTNALILFVWSLFYFIYHYFERFNISLKYEAALNEIELNSLKSQLNPHFIFNALNSIRALVDENPGKSKLAINQLSNILRNSLITDRKRLIDFESELNTVKDYLGLESIRFEERLKVNFDIDLGSTKVMVPPLMFQTLVENGIKHGVSTLKEGGEIQLKAEVIDSMLKVQIRNSGQYINGVIKGATRGYGLRNTQQRLKLIYGNKALFKIRNEGKNTVLTEVQIPLSI